jgi:hypothetical protein
MAGGDEELGEFLQGDDGEENQGGESDQERGSTEFATRECEVAEEAKCSEQAEVAELVAIRDMVEERPPSGLLAAVCNGYENDEKGNESEGGDADDMLFHEV